MKLPNSARQPRRFHPCRTPTATVGGAACVVPIQRRMLHSDMDTPSDPQERPPPLGYVSGLKSHAARVQYTDASRLVKRMLAHYGTSELYEWYKATTVGKVVFDVDGKRTATVTEATLLRDALEGVRAFFLGTMPDRFIVAASHGAGEGHPNGDKLSYRIFVPGFRMRMADIKARLLRLGLDKNRPFDAAIYGSQQKLRMVGSIKTQQDPRPLELVDVHGQVVSPTRDLLLDTLVQVVEDAWPLLTDSDAATPAALTRKRRAPSDRVEEASAPSTSAAPAVCPEVCPAPKRQRGRPPKQSSIPPDVLRILLDMHFVDPRFISATKEGFAFDAKNRDSCPNCAHDHERQNWWCIPKADEVVVANYSDRCVVKRYSTSVEVITPAHTDFEDSLALLNLEPDQAAKLRSALHYHDKVVKVECYDPDCLACDQQHDCNTYTATQLIPQHCWCVRNDDNSCKGRIFHHSPRLAAKMHALFTCPDEEALIGLFLEGHVGLIHVQRNPHATYLWATAAGGGGRWRKVTSMEFESHVSRWLNSLLQGVAALPEFKEHDKAIKQAKSKVTPGGVSRLKQLIQGRISLQAMENGTEATMDSNPLLLGAGSDVIDLKASNPDTGTFTTVLRRARPEDLVTKSVGYDVPKDGFGDFAAVEAVFAQIYPVEEERRFFQLYGGYCLLGINPAKGFLCLTDRRKGDNGKSTAVNLLRAALGADYVIDNKQNLLYEARYSTNVNAHDSGMLAFEGKRLAIMEELSANKTLDTSVMKQLTGGEAHISVRPAGAADTKSMLWSAKLITVFNEGCVPKFKVEDDAFTKRMMVMPHRAFFCKDHSMRAEHAGEEYTYDADGAKIEALEAQPWKILAWFLGGVEAYWASGKVEFQVPSACRQWAGELVHEQDPLRLWLSEHLEDAPGEYTTREAMKSAIRGHGVQLSLGSLQLNKRLVELLNNKGEFKVEHYVDGARFKAGWLHLRLV